MNCVARGGRNPEAEGPDDPWVTFERVAASPGSRIAVARRCGWLTGFSLFPTVIWKLKMLHVASPPPGRFRHSHAPRRTPVLNGEGCQCGVVVGYAPPRAFPAVGPAGTFCSRQQQWHSPHCEMHALGRADAPTAGRLQRSGSRQTRGWSYHSPGGGGRRRRGMLASRAAESVGWGARRFTSRATKRRLKSFFWSKCQHFRCMAGDHTDLHFGVSRRN